MVTSKARNCHARVRASRAASRGSATLLMRATGPPPYGAQHRQDALWKGTNEALPPLWHNFKLPNGETRYEDDILHMVSQHRPLPGVRLDQHGDLVVPGCEWHISPLGWSYFVNHNTCTTSWKKPAPERPAGSLTPECIIEGHSECIWSLACLGASGKIMSTSSDGSICQWESDGERVEKPWESDGEGVCSIAPSLDETTVVSGSADGRLRKWNIKEGSMVGEPWEGHTDGVRCLDWSPNMAEIASGSQDGTIRRWNPDTGRQLAPPIETGHGWVLAFRYSPQGDRFASGGPDNMIRVWSKDGELLIKLKGHKDWVMSLCWSKDGTHIFSASLDNTIRKWQSIDGKELVVLRGHANAVNSLCLTPDECHLVSASMDCSVRIWDLKVNQPVGKPLLHDNELVALAVSPDGTYIASAGLDAKIYVWSLEAVLKQGSDQVDAHDSNVKPNAKLKNFSTPPIPRQCANDRGLGRYGNEFWNNHTEPAVSVPSFPQRLRKLVSSLRFSTRPANAPQSMPLEPRRWNFSLFPVKISRRFVNVAHAEADELRDIASPTEIKALNKQRTSNTKANSSTRQGQPATGVEGSRPTYTTQGQNSDAATEESSCVIGCCGFNLVRRRPT